MRRYDLVDCEIIGHHSYGILLRTSEGLTGFADLSDIFDAPTSRDEWPPIGTRMTGVVLGENRSGRVRVSTRTLDVALAREVADPEQALSEWIRMRDTGFRDPSGMDSFLGSVNAAAVLRWATRQRESSPDRARGLEVLASAPEWLRSAVADN
ncbi:MAG TPA: hypothetical protein VFX70_00215 [Mycobacteriales bacterium]|nr:hypothetical protein [Mycobacteriales bacterium]